MLFTNPSTAARENMAKNRGQPGVWFAHLADYREPQPKPRVRLAKALSIARRNQPNRSMATLAGFEPISDQGKSRPESKPWCWKDWENEADECWDDVALTPARVRTEKAAENAKRFAEQKNTWHDFEGNLRYQPTPRQPRLGPGEEVQSLYEQLTRKSDWFESKATRQDSHALSQEPLVRNPTRDSSADWFKHSTKQSPGGEDIMTKPRRVRSEGLENALRNWDSSNLLSHSPGPINQEPYLCQPYGCPTIQAQANAMQAARGTGLADCLRQTMTKLRRHEDELREDEADFQGVGKTENAREDWKAIAEQGDETTTDTNYSRVAKVRGEEAREWQERGRSGIPGGPYATDKRSYTEEISQPNLNYGFRVRPGAAEIQTRNSSDVQMSILLGRDSQHPLTEVVSSELDKSTASLRTRLRTADAEACKARQWRGCMEEHIGQNVDTTGMKYHEGPKARGLTSELARSVANRSKGESMRQLLSFEQKGCKRW